MNTLTAPLKEGHLVRGSSNEAMTICVLDDEPGMVEMLQESLRCLGYSSLGTCDPQYALEMIGQGRVRVVMSDIKMPGMDGLQVPRTGDGIKRSGRLRHSHDLEAFIRSTTP